MIHERIADADNLKRQAIKRHADASSKWYWKNHTEIRKRRAKHKGPRFCEWCGKNIDKVLPLNKKFCNERCQEKNNAHRKMVWQLEKNRKKSEAKRLSRLS